MNLYRLSRHEWDYDEIIDAVVLARTVWDARKIAREGCRQGKVIDGKYVDGAGDIPSYADEFCNSAKSSCTKIDLYEPAVVLLYMRHG